MAAINRAKATAGDKFGRWTVKEITQELKSGYMRDIANVKCECGAEKFVRLDQLRSGESKSCGCLHKEIVGNSTRKHGLSGHKLYKVWETMKQRCGNQKDKNYVNYGGRGISVCDEWKSDAGKFISFAIDSGWSDGLEVDRINNDGNYEPSNIRFVTAEKNLLNKRLLRADSPTKYRGVSPLGSVFRVAVRSHGSRHSKSGFKSAHEAAIYRDRYCIANGIDLPLNFPRNKQESERT